MRPEQTRNKNAGSRIRAVVDALRCLLLKTRLSYSEPRTRAQVPRANCWSSPTVVRVREAHPASASSPPSHSNPDPDSQSRFQTNGTDDQSSTTYQSMLSKSSSVTETSYRSPHEFVRRVYDASPRCPASAGCRSGRTSFGARSTVRRGQSIAQSQIANRRVVGCGTRLVCLQSAVIASPEANRRNRCLS